MICGISVQWQSTAHAHCQPFLTARMHTASSRGLYIIGRVDYVWMLRCTLADIQFRNSYTYTHTHTHTHTYTHIYIYIYIYIYTHTHTHTHTHTTSCVLLLCQSGWRPAEEQKESDPDLNQVSLRVAWRSLRLRLTRQKYSCFHAVIRIILRNVMPYILVGTYHHFRCIDCSTPIPSRPDRTGPDWHRRQSIDRIVISFPSKISQVSGLPPCLAVNRNQSLYTVLALSPPPNYF